MSNQFSELHVFLVEPSLTQKHIIQNYLKQLGITEITYCPTGDSVFDNLALSQPQLIISAMYLPDMTGTELIHNLREYDENYDMAFMLISSETDIKNLDPIRQAGAIAILPKPFSVDELKIALTATCDFLHPEKANLDHFDIEDTSVLIVDDSPLSLKYIQRILSDLGIENITQAVDGSEAIPILEEQFFDLIITDYNMPEVDGLELTNYIREQSTQQTTPIIMVTSEQDEQRLAAVQHAGVSAILDKPFDPSSIREFIINVLS